MPTERGTDRSSPSPPEPTDGGRGKGFRALRHQGFRIYFAGMLGRGISLWIVMVSIPWFAVTLGATPAELGIVTALQYLPTLFLAPLGGVLADRIDRGRVLVAVSFVSFGLASGLALVAGLGAASIPLLGAFALGYGLVTAVELPLRQSILSELVPHQDVASAVSLHASAWNTARFLGPGVAGLLIAVAGVATAFVLSAIAALAVGWSIIRLDGHRQFRRPPELVSTGSVRDALAEGARFAAREPRIRWSLVLIAAAMMLGIQAFQTLAPLYTSELLGLGGGGYGAFVATWGAGAVVAAYVVTALASNDRRRWLFAGGLGMAIVLGAMAVTQSVPVAFMLAAALGVAQIAMVQNALVTVQEATPDALRGRVMGLYAMVFQGASPFGAVFAGLVAQEAGVPQAMLVSGALLAVIVTIGFVASRGAYARTVPSGELGVTPRAGP